jgi:hypothetical protein
MESELKKEKIYKSGEMGVLLNLGQNFGYLK